MTSTANTRKVTAGAVAPKGKVPAGAIPRRINFLLGGTAGLVFTVLYRTKVYL